MSIFRNVICPKCGEEYSAFRAGCPSCGARKQSASRRASAQSDTVRRGSPAAARREQDSRWQMIFGLCVVAAVIIAVIILIVTTVNGGYEFYPSATPSESIDLAPSPTPTPTPTPPPTPTVESITITYYGDARTEFATSVGGGTQLGATVFPIEIVEGVTWESSDPSVLTVDENGLVTGVGKGTAFVIARCYGTAAQCKVYVG